MSAAVWLRRAARVALLGLALGTCAVAAGCGGGPDDGKSDGGLLDPDAQPPVPLDPPDGAPPPVAPRSTPQPLDPRELEGETGEPANDVARQPEPFPWRWAYDGVHGFVLLPP